MSGEGTFIEGIALNAARYRERVALKEGAKELTYGELWELSGRVYASLYEEGLQAEDVVMVSVPGVIDAIIAFLGILRAGAAFVICDPALGRDKRTYMYADSGCRRLIDEQVLVRMLEEEERSGYEPREEHAAAYVIYTSGTTDLPKGVMLERGALTLSWDTFCYQGKHLVDEGSRNALLSPLTFAAGLIVVVCSLSSGGTLFVAPCEVLRNPLGLKEFFLTNAITHVFMTPSLYRTVRSFNPEMQRVFLGGEKVESIEETPSFRLYNSYAQSETGFLLTLYPIEKAMEEVPVGQPQGRAVEVRILDEDGKEVREGEVGEICYENPYFRGYTDVKEEANQALKKGLFHSGDMGRALPDGNIVLLGRKDEMVKINGIRVEPSAMEAAFRKVLPVREVRVRCLMEGNRVFICAYYTGEEELEVQKVRASLSEVLPSYMLPTHFFHLKEIPVNRNGKLDIESLPLPSMEPSGKEGVEGISESMEGHMNSMEGLSKTEQEVSRIIARRGHESYGPSGQGYGPNLSGA